MTKNTRRLPAARGLNKEAWRTSAGSTYLHLCYCCALCLVSGRQDFYLKRGAGQLANCIVCDTPNVRCQRGMGDSSRFECERCGSFVLSRTAETVLPDRLGERPLRRSVMSRTLRRMQRPTGSGHIITSDDLPSYWREDRLPSPVEQADALVLWIGANQPTPFDFAEISPSALGAEIGLQVAARGDSGGLGWLFGELARKGLFRNSDRGGKVALMLTLEGWQRYEELMKTQIESRVAFMAMKFGDAELDRVVSECFKPAVLRAGFTLRILSDEQPAGLIDNQLRAAILGSRFLISDLTHGNQGAYWEAGFAEGLGLPVIYSCSHGKWAESKTHFDTNHMFTIIWDAANLTKAGNELTATIRTTLRKDAKQSDD